MSHPRGIHSYIKEKEKYIHVPKIITHTSLVTKTRSDPVNIQIHCNPNTNIFGSCWTQATIKKIDSFEKHLWSPAINLRPTEQASCMKSLWKNQKYKLQKNVHFLIEALHVPYSMQSNYDQCAYYILFMKFYNLSAACMLCDKCINVKNDISLRINSFIIHFVMGWKKWNQG